MIDVAVAVLAGWLAWQGFRSGLTGALVWIAVVAFTPYLASQAAPHVAAWMDGQLPDLPVFVRQPAAYAVALVAIGPVIGLSLTLALRQLRGFEQRLPFIYKTDQVAGAFGVVSAGLIGIGLATVLATPLLSGPQREQLASSYWGGSIVPRLAPILPGPSTLFDAWLNRASDRIGGQVAPEDLANASRLLLGVLEASGGDGNTEVTRELLRSLSGGSGSAAVSAADAEAAKAMLAALSQTAGGSAAPEGTADAARLILQALSQ